MSAPRVELNVDLGELPDEPEELYSLATTVNLACGGHAGDARSVRLAVEKALRSGARVAAHPSYPDREGFGRVPRFCEVHDVARSIAEQCALLASVAEDLGAVVLVVKPHGALYHDAASQEGYAEAVLRGAREGLPSLATIVGPPPGADGASSALLRACSALGITYLREGFADRRYDARGGLVPRREPGALLDSTEACAAQAVALASSGRFDTIGVHGDSPGSLAIARAVHEALEARGLLRQRSATSTPLAPRVVGR